MHCPSCHATAMPGGRFCAYCGSPLPVADTSVRASRRQMTVLFCDLAGSTDLAQQIDPDDLLDALRRYHDTVRRVSMRFGGFIARIVGDGVDVYFGYPVASEDDAARALHTALALQAEVPRITTPSGTPLMLRIGVATGLVAISVSQGIAVAGTTPNLAARLQAAVPVGGIGVAPATRRIAGTRFEFDTLGAQHLKGFDEPVDVSLLQRALSLDSRSAWRGRDASLPMIGRQRELATLRERWQQAAQGQTCAVLVLGEAGLGKSRLIHALDQELRQQDRTVLRLQCSPFHVHSALHPFVQHLAAASGLDSTDSPDEQLDKLEAQLAIAGIDEPHHRALLASLLGVAFDGRYPPLALPPPMQLQMTKDVLRRYFSGLTQHRVGTRDREMLTRYFVGLADQRPLLVILEDMHWIDPTSLEVVELLLAGGDNAPILLLLTARPEFSQTWPGLPQVQPIGLQRLEDADARVVAAQQADLPAAWLAHIVERTDGVPLFIEEMTRMLLAAGGGRPDTHDTRAVPETLMDLLTARLDQLPPAGKLVAQVASVLGREFEQDLLAATFPDAPPALHEGLHALLDSGLVRSSSTDGSRLMFKHALVEDTAYASLPPKRCAALHGRVAAALLGPFRSRIEQQPEMVARHLTLAGDGLGGASWWQAAGGRALSRGAPREAAGHLRAGVAALAGAPAGEARDAAELGLLSMLGPTTMVLLGPGSAEFGAVQERAYALSCTLPGQPRLFPTTYGWSLFNWGRARLEAAGQLAARLLDAAAQRPGDTEAAMAAHNMAGMVDFHLGRPESAQAHLSQSTALYEPQRDAALYPVYLMDFGVFGRFYLALATQVRGFADAAQRIAADALRLAQDLNQPHTLGFAMLANFNTAVMRGDHAEALPMAERCIEFSGQLGFPEFIAMGRIARGWAWAHGQQRHAEGLAEVQAGIDGWAATGFENWQPWFAVLEAEILTRLGRPTEALQRLDRQLDRVAANGEHQFESPLQAERAAALATLPGREAEANAAFEQASALARTQGAAGWTERIERRRQQTLG